MSSQRRTIARYFRVRPEEIALTNGGDDALRVFFDTFVEPGSHILICEPTFPMYRYYAEIAGAKVVALRYNPEMEFPAAEALKALQKKTTRVFPGESEQSDGDSCWKRVLRKLLSAATHTVVVLDEAYSDFSGLTGVDWIRRYPTIVRRQNIFQSGGYGRTCGSVP